MRAEDRGGDRQRHGRPPLLRADGRPTTRNREFDVVTFCEEPRPAYDRVNLTKYFEQRDAAHLKLACPEWYAENGITLHVGDRATAIDRDRRVVALAAGPRDRLRLRRAGDRLGAVRSGGARRRQEGGVRLPHDRGPRADSRLCRQVDVSGGDRRRPARPRGREGRPRPRPGDPRRRVRPAADASPGRRGGLAERCSKRSRS